MEVSKIHLSSAEIELMQNAEIILTKNRVLDKMRLLLEGVQEKQIKFSDSLTSEFFNIHPKISRGENYLGLPYLILDYPRQSARNNLFFIRSMFWWGNFFSCTLHLSSETKTKFKDQIKQAYLHLGNFYLGTGDNPWVHHLKEPEYRKIDSMSKEEFDQSCENLEHIKIAGKYSLTEWETVDVALYNNWKFFLSLCGLVA